MIHYTVCLNMSQAHCLVVGMGKVGVRKLKRLLDASPLSVLVLDPAPLSIEAQQACENPCVQHEARTFKEGDEQGCFFVVASTDNHDVNTQIALLCRMHNIPCNCITTPHEGSVILPAIAEHKGVSCSITTHGASPALTKALRQELQVWLEEKTSSLSLCMARLRPHVLQAFPEKKMLYKRQEIFHALIASDLATLLQAGDKTACILLLQKHVPDSMHAILDEVLYDLI